MSLAFCTYCSKDKREDQGELLAIDRYISERITYVHGLARQQSADFFILSGKYGLLKESDEIPYYDHLLAANEVLEMTHKVGSQLRNAGITRLKCFSASPNIQPTVRPYLDVLINACVAEQIVFEISFLEPPYTD